MSAAHTATLRFRDRDARRAVLNAGHAMATIDRSAYINAATAWNREARTFALTSAAYPTLDVSVTRDQAITQLVTAYFDRYGPATVRDATWWSGLSATDITTALLACDRPVIAVATPWCADPCLMFADQVDDSAANEATTGVQFLAHEDTALKAYFQTRSRYLGGLPQQQAFNQIGEALPTVIVDGVVAGTWSWNPRNASIDVDLTPGKIPPPIRRQVKIRATALTEALRAAWAPSRPSRRLPSTDSPGVPADSTAADLTHC